MKRFSVVAVAILFLASAVQVWAFDGQRKGFILGGGLGLGMTSFTEEADLGFGTFTTDRENKFSFMTDFKIGYAPTEQVEIYYSSKVAWFDYFGITAAHGYGTAAVSYYLLPQSPTFFLSGGLGFSSISAPFESNSDSDIGFGFFVGGGYEFVRHFAVEVDLMYGRPTEGDYSFNGLVPRVTFVATAF